MKSSNFLIGELENLIYGKDMTNNMTFEQVVARNVEAEAVRHGLSKKEMGQVIGKSLMSLHSRLNGDIEFRPSELKLLADAMGIEVVEFFTHTSKKSVS